MAKQKKTKQKSVTFNGLIEQALKNWKDPAWLEKNSPLAAPYFLGDYLNSEKAGSLSRGQVLQRLLQDCSQQLTGKDSAYTQQLLHESYFGPRDRVEGLWDILGVSRAQFFVHRKQAITDLEKILVQRLNPALRLETPILPKQFIGREDEIQQCLHLLQQQQTVALSGPSGIGKTTLASYLTMKLGQESTFWFTFRPSLNDQMGTLLFALGYFLHAQGEPSLWLQLIADSGQVDLKVVLGLVRHAFKQLQETSLLLCFDEVDLLRIGEIEEHNQLLTFLESLRGVAPILFIGQQVQLEADFYQNLTGLPLASTKKLLEKMKIELPLSELEHLHEYTYGNPRLLELIIALHQSGEPITHTLNQLPNAPSVEFLLNRIWQRLDETEGQLLLSLSVFRRPVPVDAWPTTTFKQIRGIVTKLLGYRLIQHDETDSISLLPAYRITLYQRLSPEQRESLHAYAANVRQMRAQYTAAAYHYIQAGDPRQAIWLWREHKQEEINQGQANEALTLFGTVSTTNLEPETKEALILLRSQLELLTGNYQKASENLRSTLWRIPIFEIEAYELEGDIAYERSEFGQAITAYQAGIQKIESLIETQLIRFHTNLSWIYMQEKNWASIEREVLLAEYELENTKGEVQYNLGNYLESEKYHLRALELATNLKHVRHLASSYNNLAKIYNFQGKFEQAILYLHNAIENSKYIGNLTIQSGVLLNLALNQHLAGQSETAIATGKEALNLFQQLEHPWGIALACQNLAEVHIELNQLDQAEQYAYQALQTEKTDRIPDALRVLGEIYFKRGNHIEAKKHIRESINLAQQNQDPYLEAYAWRSLGEVCQDEGEIEEKDEAFGQAIELFEEMGLENEVEKTRDVMAS